MSRRSFGLVCVFSVCTTLAVSAQAAEGVRSPSAALAPVLTFRTGEHPAFDRIVFDAPKGFSYQVRKEGGQVTVAFTAAAKLTLPRFADVQRARGFTIVSGADGLAPLVVRFSVAPGAQLHDFLSESSIVIDVMGPRAPEGTGPAKPSAKEEKPPVAEAVNKEKTAPPSPAPSPASAPATPTPAPIAEKEKAVEKTHPTEKTAAVETKPAVQPAATLAPPKAAMPPATPPATSAPVTPPKAGTVPPPAPVPSSAPTPAPTRGSAATPAPAPAAPLVEKPGPGVDASLPTAPTPQAAPSPVVEKGDTLAPLPKPALIAPSLDPKTIAAIQAIVNEKPAQPVVSFDPKISAGAAVFVRAGYVTILFDRKLSPPPFMVGTSPRVKLEPFDLPRNSGLRIAVPDGVNVRATRTETSWDIYLVPAGTAAGVSTEFVAQPGFALGARLLVPTAGPPDPVFLQDPVVGDDLLIIPLRETGAFTVPRHLADFDVIPSAQGLVVKPLHEKVVARIVPDGIEITSEGGLKLSPPADAGTKSGEAEKSLGQGKVLFDFARWRGRQGDPFIATRQRLIQTIASVPENERVLARLDLARFYFSYGLGTEALAILEVIRKALPEIETQPDFLALRGASLILEGRARDGLADLALPALAQQPETSLWQAIGSASSRDWASAIERFHLNAPLLFEYPEPFRSRFIVLAVETALAAGKDRDGADWLARLEKDGYDPSVKAGILYLRGVMEAKQDHADRAEKLWREAAKDGDRLYKIRSELALVDLSVATKSMTPKQAADRLEGLRFAWRGDDLEFDILERLGGFYIDGHAFRKGLTVMGEGLRLYPTSPRAPELRAEMTKLFTRVFLTDLGKSLSPLDALNLYTDFKVLIPAGEDGNVVRRNLAERLVDIDLLDPAAKLLDEIVKNSSKPEDRAKTVLRLAAVRLLDHKATEALTILDQGQADAAALPPEGQAQRQLLRARALSEMGKYEDALAALPPQAAPDTLKLRADIAMRAKHWGDAVNALIELVGPPPKPGTSLPEDKAGWLVSAALAMAQGGDAAGLDRLGADYAGAMNSTTKADMFKILTRPDQMMQVKDVAAVQSKLSEVDLFRDFLDSFRKGEGQKQGQAPH